MDAELLLSLCKLIEALAFEIRELRERLSKQEKTASGQHSERDDYLKKFFFESCGTAESDRVRFFDKLLRYERRLPLT